MYDPGAILEWIEREVTPMRKSRAKTLAAVVAAEGTEFVRHFRHDTGSARLINIARLGYSFLQIAAWAIPTALAALNNLPP